MIVPGERGQVLAFFAILLPIVLLPLVAYAVDTAFVGTRAASLEQATMQAAEAASQQLDIGAFRLSSNLVTDVAPARAAAAESMRVSEPEAWIQSVIVSGATVTVAAAELIKLPFTVLPATAIRLESRASAQLVAGYDRPSSRLPLPANTF
jgi:Flp pilus assembly protein TadG